MTIIRTSLEKAEETIHAVLEQQEEACVYCLPDEACAVVGSCGGADVQWAQRNGVRTGSIQHEGGTIILSPGDVEIAIFTHDYSGHTYRQLIVETLMDKLRQGGHDVRIDGNDVMLNGKKVVGYGSRRFGELLYTAIHFSVGVNEELIGHICTKPTRKLPDGMSRYGITTEDILAILSDALGEAFTGE